MNQSEHLSIYLQLIQIFGAGERTDEGVPRGPRGPKKVLWETP